MEDVGRVPTDLPAAPPLEPTTIPTLDGWIESLMTCKQLAESDVQRLCEKVRAPVSMPILRSQPYFELSTIFRHHLSGWASLWFLPVTARVPAVCVGSQS